MVRNAKNKHLNLKREMYLLFRSPTFLPVFCWSVSIKRLKTTSLNDVPFSIVIVSATGVLEANRSAHLFLHTPA